MSNNKRDMHPILIELDSIERVKQIQKAAQSTILISLNITTSEYIRGLLNKAIEQAEKSLNIMREESVWQQ